MAARPVVSMWLDTEGGQLSADNRRASVFGTPVLTALSGWYGGVAITSESTDRLGFGEFLSQGRGSARVLTLGVSFQSKDETERRHFRRAWSGAFHDGMPATLKVDWAGLVLSAEVVQDGEVAITDQDPHGVRVMAPLRAADPHLYGEQQTVFLHPIGSGVGLEYPLFLDGVLAYGSAVDSQDPISNPGNAVAWPHFLVTGDFPSGFRLSSGGRVVVWPNPVFPQSPVLVDMSGSIWVGSENQTYRAGRTDWFSIPAGGTIHPMFEPIQFGSGWAEARIWPTFM